MHVNSVLIYDLFLSVTVITPIKLLPCWNMKLVVTKICVSRPSPLRFSFRINYLSSPLQEELCFSNYSTYLFPEEWEWNKGCGHIAQHPQKIKLLNILAWNRNDSYIPTLTWGAVGRGQLRVERSQFPSRVWLLVNWPHSLEWLHAPDNMGSTYWTWEAVLLKRTWCGEVRRRAWVWDELGWSERDQIYYSKFLRFNKNITFFLKTGFRFPFSWPQPQWS